MVTEISAGREAATSRWVRGFARAGLVARGVNYLLLGLLAWQIAFGRAGRHAVRVGALREVATHRGGLVVLWLLAVGFGAMTIWRLTEAAYGRAGPDGRKPLKRLTSLAGAIGYGALATGTTSFLLGNSSQSSGNRQSKALTARFMSHPGGRWLVLLVGLVVIGVGLALVVGGLRKTFLKNLSRARMSPRARPVVELLGMVGISARGIAFGAVGVFLAVAAITFDPKKAQGLDGALYKLATTRLGPWLLVAVAAGLVMFGCYSFCEARWRNVTPG